MKCLSICCCCLWWRCACVRACVNTFNLIYSYKVFFCFNIKSQGLNCLMSINMLNFSGEIWCPLASKQVSWYHIGTKTGNLTSFQDKTFCLYYNLSSELIKLIVFNPAFIFSCQFALGQPLWNEFKTFESKRKHTCRKTWTLPHQWVKFVLVWQTWFTVVVKKIFTGCIFPGLCKFVVCKMAEDYVIPLQRTNATHPVFAQSHCSHLNQGVVHCVEARLCSSHVVSLNSIVCRSLILLCLI